MILYINPVIFYLFLLLIQINRCTSVFFYFGSFICNPLHAARWAMAAAPSCSSPRPQLNYPPVYPFPTPGPACAVIVGVSPRSHSPHICQTKKRKQKTQPTKTDCSTPRGPPPARGPNSTWPPSPSSIAGGLRSRSLRGALATCSHCERCDLSSRCSCPANPARWGQPAYAHPCGVGGAWCG